MVKEYSLYIHIPFCSKKCDYCHFFVVPFKQKFVDDFLTALRKEIHLYESYLLNTPVSLYFGGGTPSLLSPDELATIINALPFKIPPDCEVTLEANPESIELAKMKEYASLGINRVSVGAQSFDNALLTTLTRNHEASKVKEGIWKIKEAGIDNISIDLMYDLPGQTLESWHRTLDEASALPVTHLSLYNLTLEPHTVFYKKRAALSKTIPNDATSLQMLEDAILHLESIGLKRYEISAFARSDKVSRHNLGYWQARSFLGWGPSAFSYWKGRRFRNVCHLNRYVEALKSDKLPVDFEEELTREGQTRELIAVALRVLEGVDLRSFAVSSTLRAILDSAVEKGLLCYRGEKLALTNEGLLYYDTLAAEIIE